MSDTDDTDLLLLIPPDFFLVRSDLEDFDSDSDIGFGHKEVKDIIVSDLITQVNDLESRICQIESLDRTSTRCSTCNDDSLINQSIISLTESDVLRAQIKEHRGFLKKGLTDTSLMVKSIGRPNDTGSADLTFESDIGVKKLDGSLVRPESVKSNIVDTSKHNTVNVYSCEKSNTDINTQNHLTSIQKKVLVPESQLSREEQTQLLNEVDSFLLSKQFINGTTSEYNELYEDNNHQRVGQEDQEFVNTTSNNASIADGLPHPPEVVELDVNNEDHAQSLALTEVYKLISEMEETQNEMQKKLSGNGFQLPLQSQDKNNHATGANRHLKSLSQLYSSKVLDLEDISTKSPRPFYSKQSEDALDKFKNGSHNFESLDAYRLNKNTETNYLLTQFPPTAEEKHHQRTSKPKSLSPNRVPVGSYNPIDIVRANLPGRKDDRITQIGEGKDSPIKSVGLGLRRQLHFEKPLSPLRASKSRTSLHAEQRTYNQNENQNKNESDRSSIAPFHRNSRHGRTNHSLEDKFNILTVQRASGTNNRENENVDHHLVNKAASETLQQKISSNNLLSLSELWNKEPTFYSDDPNKLRQKLEEERYRRQHCEQQIQALQVRVLEEQEKLAVAIRVDQEKDRAIMQITESWKKLNDHWGELEEQRHSLAQQLQAERESSKIKSEELTKKVERWEKEVSQALDLAAGYKEKSEVVQKQMESLKRDTDEKLQQVDNELQTKTEESEKLIEENNNLTEQLKTLQQQMKEEEDMLSKLKAELEKSRKRLMEFEAENSVLREQKSSLTTGIKEERNRISILDQKLNSLQQALNEAYKREKAAQEELRVSQERVEVARTELRALYQGQLEAVLKEKLQEFQAQLEAAEAALKAELHAKEKQWAEKSNEHYRQLHDKYKRDLLRVEEIHKGEVNSWKDKLLESERLRAAVEKKLQEEADRRADIAQRLHSVMETQWREALNIISNPMKALYEMPKEENQTKWPSNHRQQGQSPERLQGQGDVRVSRSGSTTSLGPGEDVPFSREGMVTYRTSQPAQDHQLKKYIQMLLERGPGNPVPPQNCPLQDSSEQHPFPPGNNDLFDKWIMENERKLAGQSDKQNQSNKPPWR